MRFISNEHPLSELTLAQQARIANVREEFFNYATSTVTDRPAAEEAIATLFGSIVPSNQVTWVTNPEAGFDLYSTYINKGTKTLQQFFGVEGHVHSTANQLYELLGSISRRQSEMHICGDLWQSINHQITHTIYNLVRETIPLVSYLLKDAQVSSFRDSSWAAFHTFCSGLDEVQYTLRTAAQLGALTALLKSSFATWVVPQYQVIICDKPTKVVLKGDKLVSLEFADPNPSLVEANPTTFLK